MKYDFSPIMDAARVSEQSQNTVIRLLVQALEQMERRVRDLEDDYDNAKPKDEDDFSEKVLEVLRVRSGSARYALEVLGNDCEFDSRVLSVIEDNSYTTFTHIEAEIDEKLDQMTQSYGFAEAVEEAVKGSIVSTVEDVIADLGVIDPEDIVRAGLRAII
jgi:hypothetical protein